VCVCVCVSVYVCVGVRLCGCVVADRTMMVVGASSGSTENKCTVVGSGTRSGAHRPSGPAAVASVSRTGRFIANAALCSYTQTHRHGDAVVRAKGPPHRHRHRQIRTEAQRHIGTGTDTDRGGGAGTGTAGGGSVTHCALGSTHTGTSMNRRAVAVTECASRRQSAGGSKWACMRG
jgi:hypothetical protein